MKLKKLGYLLSILNITYIFVDVRGYSWLKLFEKTKPISRPSAGNPKLEYRNSKGS